MNDTEIKDPDVLPALLRQRVEDEMTMLLIPGLTRTDLLHQRMDRLVAEFEASVLSRKESSDV